MPNEGNYRLKQISKAGFVSILKTRSSEVISRIGYPQNIQLIRRWTGINFSMSRDKTKLDNGDEMLCMCLKYRKDGYKGQEVGEKDFQFFHCIFEK